MIAGLRLILGICALAGSATARPPGAPIPVRQYAAAIHAVRVSLDRQLNNPSEVALGQIERRLRGLDLVRLPDGSLIETSTSLLAGALGTDRSSLVLVAAAIDQLDADLRANLQGSFRASDLSALDVVLRDPRFHAGESPAQRFVDWIGEQASRLLSLLGAIGHTGNIANTLVAAAFVLVAVAVAYLAARGALRRAIVEVRPSQEPNDEDLLSGGTRNRAGEFAMTGDYRAAFRYLFLAALLELQNRGLIELKPGATNRESLRERLKLDDQVGREIAQPLSQLVDAFDQIWYGHHSIDASMYRELSSVVDHLLAAARAGRAAA
jgi:Domain of unknown function (DUF4129)